MRTSELFTKTKKELPSEEASINAQLLTRAGYISREAAGAYNYLPLGKRVLDKISQVVREEMDKIGGQEILLTALQSKELWELTGRWDDKVVDVWFKTKLKSGSELGLGFTQEEPLTALLRNYVSSHQDLPLLIYQIQTKFRNELRAKSGLMRGREFLMKDMYSFARDQAEHKKLFEKVKQAYIKIYERLGIGDLTYFTAATGGSFSKEFSYEFQTVAENGEDVIYADKTLKLAVNEEVNGPEALEELGLDPKKLEKIKVSEVGNIFNLGTKYSSLLGLNYVNEKNQESPVIMGCYGLGVSRTMGIIAEVLSDKNGLIWPEEIAPYQIYLTYVGSSSNTKKAAEDVYKRLTEAGVEVLYDDRDARAGEKFADADLIGLPYRVVSSDKTVEEGKVELKKRTASEQKLVEAEELVKIFTNNHKVTKSD
ncbi:MAG TPA: aminoacyl--tRNA ligase-related protein [Candidatus Saccharimonadales bacterium]|nr:aminoacyl--tRNA ligase-related protein [Candidatus Saccharimonadales bacterium]